MKWATAIFLAAMSMTAQAGQVLLSPNFNTNEMRGFSFVNECSGGEGVGWPPAFDDPPVPVPVNGLWETGYCSHDEHYVGGVTITRVDGHPFNLLLFASWPPLQVTSSAGGDIVILDWDPQVQNRHVFGGPEWNDLSWIYINPCYADFVCHQQATLGDFVFSVQVPEPAPLTLIGLALVGLALFRQRAMTIA